MLKRLGLFLRQPQQCRYADPGVATDHAHRDRRGAAFYQQYKDGRGSPSSIITWSTPPTLGPMVVVSPTPGAQVILQRSGPQATTSNNENIRLRTIRSIPVQVLAQCEWRSGGSQRQLSREQETRSRTGVNWFRGPYMTRSGTSSKHEIASQHDGSYAKIRSSPILKDMRGLLFIRILVRPVHGYTDAFGTKAR